MATTFDPHGTDDLSLPADDQPDGAKLASGVIRDKLARIYAEEPDATQELAEAAQVEERSPHQQFMYDLSTSGKDLATIQTEWHNYYEALPDDEKHAVWHEFYASQSLATQLAPGPAAGPSTGMGTALAVPAPPTGPTVSHQDQAAPLVATADPFQALAKNKSQKAGLRNKAAAKAAKPRQPAKKLRDARSAKDVQAAIRDTVTAGGQLETKHHLQSLLFGLGMGLIVVIIFLFSFFNEIIIAPFIQPSRVAASTPLIVNSNSVAPSSTPEVIIPKINVQIPTDYSQTTTSEAAIETALESGVVHYPTTSRPGQAGNAAFFGHSSNNIFNKGKYKFAFVLLHTLVEGDTFYLTADGKVYVYKVITKKVVEPTEVSVLDPVPGKTATATLITCDPPGTSLHRLIIVGEQISPDPAGNTPASSTITAASATSATTAALPGNGPTLFGRALKTAVGKAVLVILPIAAVIIVFRQVKKRH